MIEMKISWVTAIVCLLIFVPGTWGQDATTGAGAGASTSPDANSATASPPKTPLTPELVNDLCGDPEYRFHYKKYDQDNIPQGLSELDACCTSPRFSPDSEQNILNDACCLVQGSTCSEGGIPCCKNANCSKTLEGDMKCPFKSGFWMTSRKLQASAVDGWKPSHVPRFCNHEKYTFFREVVSANMTPGGRPVSGCCAIQDTTEAKLVRRYCCVNSQHKCCFANGYCTTAIPSRLVSYEERETDFQAQLPAEIQDQFGYMERK